MVLCYCALMCLLLLMMFSVLSMAWVKSTGKLSFTNTASGEQRPGRAILYWLAVSCPTPDFGAWSGLSSQVTPAV